MDYALGKRGSFSGPGTGNNTGTPLAVGSRCFLMFSWRFHRLTSHAGDFAGPSEVTKVPRKWRKPPAEP